MSEESPLKAIADINTKALSMYGTTSVIGLDEGSKHGMTYWFPYKISGLTALLVSTNLGSYKWENIFKKDLTILGWSKDIWRIFFFASNNNQPYILCNIATVSILMILITTKCHQVSDIWKYETSSYTYKSNNSMP